MEILHDILHVLLHSLGELALMLPILFLTYLGMEALEHHAREKTLSRISGAKRVGPLLGGALGIIPQCGVAGGAANLYAGRVITAGTFLAVLLSTSDEMIPVLISNGRVDLIAKTLGFKLIFAVLAGFIFDGALHLYRKRKPRDHHAKSYGECCDGHSHGEEYGIEIHEMCHREGCECHGGVLRPALRHTLRAALLILAVSFSVSLAVHFIGEERLVDILPDLPVLGEAVAALVGFIPSCSVSVVLTEFYLGGIIGAGEMMAGLLVNGGVGLLVLFKMNRGEGAMKKNIALCAVLYLFGLLGGLLAGFII